MALIEFVVPGQPRGKQSLVPGKFGAFIPKQTTNEMKAVSYIALAAMRGLPLFMGPLKVQMVAVFAVPSGFSRAKRQNALDGMIVPTMKPDADNISKLIGDAIKGVVYGDDAQITRLQVIKQFGTKSAVHVRVEEIEGVRRHDAAKPRET